MTKGHTRRKTKLRGVVEMPEVQSRPSKMSNRWPVKVCSGTHETKSGEIHEKQIERVLPSPIFNTGIPIVVDRLTITSRRFCQMLSNYFNTKQAL